MTLDAGISNSLILIQLVVYLSICHKLFDSSSSSGLSNLNLHSSLVVCFCCFLWISLFFKDWKQCCNKHLSCTLTLFFLLCFWVRVSNFVQVDLEFTILQPLEVTGSKDMHHQLHWFHWCYISYSPNSK